MGLKIDIDRAIELSGYKGKFKDSLRQILGYIEFDDYIETQEQAAYLLATALVESEYSLQRWEADSACGLYGKPYKDKPCQAALNYYRSTAGGKKNYYTLGVDSRGLPYFGRGLIQLTGKPNYQAYSKIIGIDLIGNPELALDPKNSYNIASSYMNHHKYNGKSTYEWVTANDLTKARKAVNGSTRDIDKVNKAFNMWKNVLMLTFEKKKSYNKSIVIVGTLTASLVGLYFLYKYARKNKYIKL